MALASRIEGMPEGVHVKGGTYYHRIIST